MAEGSVSVKVRLANGQMPIVSALWNVSLGGLFFEMPEPMAFGVEAALEFVMQQEPRIVRCKGFVVWTSKTSPDKAAGKIGVALRLADIKIAEMRVLAQAVGQNL